MKHPTSVENMTAEELAEKFMNTTYGYHLAFFKKMAELYRQESIKDQERGYLKLYGLLYDLANVIVFACSILERIWKICEPYNNKKTEIKEEE